MESFDIPPNVRFVFRIGHAVYAGARLLAQVPKPTVQRLRRQQVSDREKLPLPILLGQLGYAMDFLALPSAGNDEIAYAIR